MYLHKITHKNEKDVGLLDPDHGGVDRTDPTNRLSHGLRETQVELLAIERPILPCIHLRIFENSPEAPPDLIVSVRHCLEASAKKSA